MVMTNKKRGNTMENKLTVDKEFMQLIPPLLEEEYRQLEQNILAKGKLLKSLAKERLKRAGGDKYGKKPPMSESSTTNEETGTVRKSLAKNAGVGQGTIQRYTQVMKRVAQH